MYAKLQLSKSIIAIEQGSIKEGLDIKELSFILSQLPEGTTITSIKALPITDLSITYEITLYNTLFKNNSIIKNNNNRYCRALGYGDNNQTVLYNHLDGYYDFSDAIRREKCETIKKQQEVDEKLQLEAKKSLPKTVQKILKKIGNNNEKN